MLLDRTLALQSYPPNFEYEVDAGTPNSRTLVGDRAILADVFERGVLGPNGSTGIGSEINGTFNNIVPAPSRSDLKFIDHNPFIEQGLPNLSQQVFKYNTLREVISQLAQYVGFDYYVDYDQEITLFLSGKF